jgi:uncharacterized membrane protein YkvA (DUF1232 family)
LSSPRATFCGECGQQLDSAGNLRHLETIKDITEEVRVQIRNVTDKSSAKRIESINALGAMRCVDACDCLGNALKDPDRQVRLHALRALENIGELAYHQIVMGLLEGFPDVRKLAATILGRMGKKEAIIPLISTLKEKDNLVRLSSVRALGSISIGEDRDSVKRWRLNALVRSLRDPDWDVQQAAKIALIKAGPLACDSLRDACGDRDALMRKSAAEILSKIEQSQRTADTQQGGSFAEVESRADETKNRAEGDTKVDLGSVEDRAKAIQDRINDVFKRKAMSGYESEVIAENVQIPISKAVRTEAVRTVQSPPSPSSPESVVNVKGVPTSIRLEASNMHPVVHEVVSFTAALTAGTTPVSKSVTIWHKLKGARYDDITMDSPCKFTKNWRFSGIRHYYATFAGDGIHAASTSAALDINVGAHASTETDRIHEAFGKHPSVSESSEKQPAYELAQLDVSHQKRCQRCDSVFEPHAQEASQVLCKQCFAEEQNAEAVDTALGLTTCVYCKRKFKPNDVSILTGFCSKACSAKAQDAAKLENQLARPTEAPPEGALAVHVAGQSDTGLAAASTQNLDSSCDIPNWSYETLLNARVTQYGGPYKDIAAFAVPFYKLLCGLLNDVLVDWHTKIMISSALGYLVLAEDVIPDQEDNGLIDDIFIMADVLQDLKEHFSERIEDNWDEDDDICSTIDTMHDACYDLVQSQAWEILQRVGLQKFRDLELEEYSGDYPKRLARVAQEKRELLGLLAYVMRQMGHKKVDRSRVENIRRQIEQSGNAAEINRIIELAKKDHDIKVKDEGLDEFKEEYEREMNEMLWK